MQGKGLQEVQQSADVTSPIRRLYYTKDAGSCNPFFHNFKTKRDSEVPAFFFLPAWPLGVHFPFPKWVQNF